MPLRAVLTEVVRQGNPGKIESVREPRQKLIWCLRDSEQNGGPTVILVTTRSAAAAESLDLPTEFAIP